LFCHTKFFDSEICAVLSLFSCAIEYERLREAFTGKGLIECFCDVVNVAPNDKILVPALAILVRFIGEQFETIAGRVGRFVDLLGSQECRVACGGAILIRKIIRAEPLVFEGRYHKLALLRLVGKVETAPYALRTEMGRTLIAVLRETGWQIFEELGDQLVSIIIDLLEADSQRLVMDVLRYLIDLRTGPQGMAIVERIMAEGRLMHYRSAAQPADRKLTPQSGN
jgi:hypothetical protein